MGICTRLHKIEQTLDVKERVYVDSFADWVKTTTLGKQFIARGKMREWIRNIEKDDNLSAQG